MRIKFVTSIASTSWSFDPGQIVEMPDEAARGYLKSGLAVEVAAIACPHCGGELERQTPPGPEAPLEAATIASTPRRRSGGS